MNDNCVFCHRQGQIAPFTLTSYEDAAGWAGMIEEVVGSGRMPPWHADPHFGHFKNDARLSDADKATIAKLGRRRRSRKAIPRTCPSRRNSPKAG